MSDPKTVRDYALMTAKATYVTEDYQEPDLVDQLKQFGSGDPLIARAITEITRLRAELAARGVVGDLVEVAIRTACCHRRIPPSEPDACGYPACGCYRMAVDQRIALAVLAAVAPGIRAGVWQPIETAPHATDVLLFIPSGDIGAPKMEVGQASWGWRNEVASNMSYHGHATHWRPLPKPPASTGAANVQS